MRPLLFYLTCLVFGLIANLLSAWICVAVAEWPAKLELAQLPAPEWPRVVPSHWPQPRRQLRVDQFGFKILRTLGRTYSAGSSRIQESSHFLIDIYVAGWPLYAFQCETWREYQLRRGSTGTAIRVEAHPDPTAWIVGLDPPAAIAKNNPWKRLPIRPTSPTAFLANTLFFGLVFLVVVKGPLFLRRLVRLHHGSCPHCGYPSGHSPVCTECGHVLRKRSVT